MFNKKPVLKYESALEEYPDSIVSAKTKIPDWYKKILRSSSPIDENNNITINLKHCMPFIEALSCGYFITLPYDLYVKDNNGRPFVLWRDTEQPPKWRDEVSHENTVPTGYAPIEYTWNACVSFVVPEGYSLLVTHPLNRYDLPFITLSGVIDGGYVASPHGNFPFYVKSGFEGVIPQGTPIAQIIPFRQESWTSEKEEGLVKQGNINNKKSMSVLSGWYKKSYWKRKSYL